jgi:ATP synthase subunit 10
MKYSILFSIFIISIGSLLALTRSDNKPFPVITGISLNDKPMTLPDQARGKFAIVAMIFSMKAETDVIPWMDPINKTIMGNIMFQANVFFVPMTGAIKGVNEELVKKKLKESMDTSLYKYVLLYKGPTDEIIKQLHVTDRDEPYFFVIDPRGKLTFTTSGKYTEDKLEEIADKISE